MRGFYDRGSKPQIIHSTVLFIKKPSILEQPSCQGSPAGRQSTEGVSHHHDRKAVATGGTASTTEVWGQIEVAVGEQGATGGKQQTGGEFQGPAHLEDSPDFIRLGLKKIPVNVSFWVPKTNTCWLNYRWKADLEALGHGVCMRS